MNDKWFEEELAPVEASIQEIVKSIKSSVSSQEVKHTARGILRADKPRWGQLDPDSAGILSSGVADRFYLVRLGFQFDISHENLKKGVKFIYARCSAYLWAARGGEPHPRVYEVIPRDLYEGEQRRVSIKIGPEIKIGEVGGSLGELSTDFAIGTVEPVIVGWPGQDERAPYWDLRPKSQTLLGIRHLWLVIEVPLGCSSVRLAALAEGDLQTHFGPISVGPQRREWASRPSIVIE